MKDQASIAATATDEVKESSNLIPAKKEIIQFEVLDISSLPKENQDAIREDCIKEAFRIIAKGEEGARDNTNLASKIGILGDASQKESEIKASYEFVAEHKDTYGNTKVRISDKETHISKTNSIRNHIWAGVAVLAIIGAVIVGVFVG